MWFHSPTYRFLIHSVAVLVFSCVFSGCSGGGGGDSSPTAPPLPEPTPAPMQSSSGAFDVVGAGQDASFALDSASNTVFCDTNAGWASLWVRLGQDSAGNGGGGPHLDIDLCNHGGGGTFGPKDPDLLACSGGKLFDIWWHGSDGSVFNNEAMGAGACSLMLTEDGGGLIGTFACSGLTEVGGNRSVDVMNGSFECTVI